MTLDETIEYLEDFVNNTEIPCEGCKDKPKQLLEWLKELKTFREKEECKSFEFRSKYDRRKNK